MQVTRRSTPTFRYRYFLTVFAVLTFMTLPSSVGHTSREGVTNASAVNELARMRLTPTTRTRRIEEGKATLRLSVSEQTGTSFQAFSEVEGGIFEERLYAMWLESSDIAQKDKAFLLDVNEARKKCEIDPDTGKGFECEKIAKFRSRLTEMPFNVTTLEGLTVNIREHLFDRHFSEQLLVATGTVTKRDLR